MTQPSTRSHRKLWRYLMIKEVFIVSLALCSLIFLTADLLALLSSAQLAAVYVYDIAVGLIFIAEFFIEMALVSNKRAYFVHNWYYLLAAIPLPMTFAEALRGLRILRIVKLLRFAAHASYEKRLKHYWYSH